METYTARKRFFYKSVLVKPGEEIELNTNEAARYMYFGYIKAAVGKPKRVMKRKNHARLTD